MGEKSIEVIIDVFRSDTEISNLVTLPKNAYEEIEIHSKNILNVGMLESDVECRSNSSENTIEIPDKLSEYFGIVHGMKTNLLIKGNKICLGPVIAVFVSNGTITKASRQSSNFRLVETFKANNDAKTIVYYFSVKDVDFINHKINGTYFNEESLRWDKKYFPFPDVLYDRGGGTLKKQIIISEYIRAQFELYNDLKKINSKYYFDKWDLHEKLVKYKDMEPHLPVTILYEGVESLGEMFHEFSTIYIKTCLGNNGKGVARASKLDDGTYHFSYFHDKVMQYRLSSIIDLAKQIKITFEEQKIILQSAIDVIEIDGRRVDMRATVQRNGKGELGVYAHPVRLGKENCPITSTKSGSTVYVFDNFFQRYFNYNEEQIQNLKKKINEMLFKSFKYVEHEYGSFGELGIDFAIDKYWNIWFIECNAKPGKDTVYLSYDKDTVKKAFLNPLEYAKFISGF